MECKNINIEDLLVRILENRASREEIRYFYQWMKVQENQVFFTKFKKLWNLSTGSHASRDMLESGIKDYQIFMKKSLKSKKYIKLTSIISTSAALLLIVLTTTLWLRKDISDISENKKYVVSTNRGIILKLADNNEIILNDSLFRTDIAGKMVSINKNEQREIIYEIKNSTEIIGDEELNYNQIIVPAGERFFVQLSDGSKAWLNSESSLRFPTYFGKNIREVEVLGNIYFEVAKDSTRPFIVISPKIKTEVLGTSFEINAYEDNNTVSTTLVEGSVRVSAGDHFAIINPNQQFTFDTKSGIINISEVDANKKVIWKDGILLISNETFQSLIWKLERWYGVEIINETGLEFTQLFSGEFDRENIQLAIESLCTNLNINYIIDNEQIHLKRE